MKQCSLCEKEYPDDDDVLFCEACGGPLIKRENKGEGKKNTEEQEFRMDRLIVILTIILVVNLLIIGISVAMINSMM